MTTSALLDQVSQCFAPGRGVEVEHHTLVTVVQPVEEPRIARPGAIGPVHALDLDNSQIRASEQMRAERAGPHRREVHHDRVTRR